MTLQALPEAGVGYGNTQLICDAEAFSVCGCTGEPYSCDCSPNDARTKCVFCKHCLILIDCDTGEPIARTA